MVGFFSLLCIMYLMSAAVLYTLAVFCIVCQLLSVCHVFVKFMLFLDCQLPCFVCRFCMYTVFVWIIIFAMWCVCVCVVGLISVRLISKHKIISRLSSTMFCASILYVHCICLYNNICHVMCMCVCIVGLFSVRLICIHNSISGLSAVIWYYILLCNNHLCWLYHGLSHGWL